MAATPTIVIGRNNWGIKLSNLLGYYQSDDGFFVKREFSATRASLATRVNSSGFIEAPRTNLALQSENFGTTWTQTNLLAFGSGSVLNTTGTLDPFGGNSADLIVANTTPAVQHRVDQVTVSASGSYTFSVFVKAAGYNFCRLRIGSVGGDFNLNTGAITVTDTGIVTSIRSFGNGWYRCIISKAASTANETVRINMQPASNTGDFAGDGISGIYIYGAQYEPTANVTDYIPTTTSAVTIFGGLTVNAANANNIPRIDYTGGSPALLIEPAATNSIRNNTMVGAVAGTPGTLPTNHSTTLNGLTRTIVGVGSENGVDYIDVQVSGTATGAALTYSFETNSQIVAASGQAWTNSMWIKQIADAGGNRPAARVTIYEFNSGGTYLAEGSAIATLTSSLTRFSFTRTLANASTARVQPLIQFVLVSGTTYNFTIRIGLPQMELGSVATSVIPTTTAAASRSADVVTLSGATDYIGQTEGTIYWEGNALSNNTNTQDIIYINRNVTNSVVFLKTTTTNWVARIYAGGSTALSIIDTTVRTGFLKVAIAYKSGDTTFYINGTKIGSTNTTAFTFTAALDSVVFGHAALIFGPGNQQCRDVALYNTRLSDSELAALTTL